jgi:hypothetical protein
VHKTINALLSAPQYNSQFPSEYNAFSLVRNPNQTIFDVQCTTPPIPSSFETGFLGYERAQIRGFVTERLSDNAARRGWLEPGYYALLDEFSLEGENTVVLGIALSSLHDRDPSGMTDDEIEQWWTECEEQERVPDKWREFRVKFDEADKLATVLTMESDFTQKLYNDDFVAEYTDERGVFQLARAQHVFETSHDL